MSTSRKKEVHEVVDRIIFFHFIYHFDLVFDRELIANDFTFLRDMLDTLVDVEIKEKEEFIK